MPQELEEAQGHLHGPRHAVIGTPRGAGAGAGVGSSPAVGRLHFTRGTTLRQQEVVDSFHHRPTREEFGSVAAVDVGAVAAVADGARVAAATATATATLSPRVAPRWRAGEEETSPPRAA